MNANYDNNYFRSVRYNEKVKLNPEYKYTRPNEYTNDQWTSYIYYLEIGDSLIKRDRIYNDIVNQFSNQIGNENVLNKHLFDDIIKWIKNTPVFKQRNFMN